MDSFVRNGELGQALACCENTVFEINKYISAQAPWKLLGGNLDDKAQHEKVVYRTADALRIVALNLQPFMPAKSSTILDHLGVTKRYWAMTKRNSWEDKAKLRLIDFPLFPQIR